MRHLLSRVVTFTNLLVLVALVGSLAVGYALGQASTTTQVEVTLPTLPGEPGATGECGPQGIPGEPASAPVFGAFIDTSTQTNPVANVARLIRFNTTIVSQGVTIADQTRITVAEDGIYNLQFSAQFVKSNQGVGTVDIWFSRNGVYEPMSSTRITLDDRNSANVASWNIFLELSATEYAELYWASPDPNISIPTLTNLIDPPRPDIPSLILTVDRVN